MADNTELTKEEIEQDLKDFLQCIEPVIDIAVQTKGTRLTLGIAKIVKRIGNGDLIKNPDKLEPLLEKYQYLLQE